MSKRKTKKQRIPKKFDPLIAKLPDGIKEQRPLIFEPRGEKKMSVTLTKDGPHVSVVSTVVQ